MVNPKNNSSKSRLWDNCALCEGELTVLESDFLICNGCGLLVRKGREDVKKLYQTGWKSPLENLNITGGTSPQLGENYIRELVRTLRTKDLCGKKILDFGSGRGEMALALESMGAKVIAVDPFSYLQLREKGLAAVESLEQLDTEQKFDGAVSIDVFEHLTTPWQQLQTIRLLLKEGGWLYLSTPNAGGLNARVNKESWREALNPSHILLFTPQSMELLLNKAGFQRYQRLRWNVKFSENNLIQVKDWILRSIWLDGVLRYLAYA